MDRQILFSVNLKKARLAQKQTQKELGEALGFSEKTVSKWECGVAMPDIDTLFSLCDQLKLGIGELFADEQQYYLGIDGGGTKTVMVLADGEGKTLRTLKTEACNPVDLGIESAKQILKNGIFEICSGIPMSQITLFAGIAGGTSGDMKPRLAEFFGGFGFRDFRNDSDNLNIIAAGLGNRNGITVILGTGFCVYTQIDGRYRRIGGWGYLIDEGGSGYNFGRDALHAYFSAFDGSGEDTLLVEEIDRIYPGGPNALVSYIYANGKKAVASFAMAVFSACRRGDKVAQRILQRNIREVTRIIGVAAADFPDGVIPVVFAGGLTNEELVISELKKELIPERYQMERLQCEPVSGAVMLARNGRNE